MAFLKCSMLISYTSNISNATTGARVAGFSEQLYRSPSNDTVQKFEQLCQLRSFLLPQGSRIVGQRYQIVDPVGGSSTGSRVFLAGTTLKPDVPQMALLLRLKARFRANFRPYYFRALPDVRSVEGEYAPSNAFTTALNNYLARLQADTWRFKAVDLDADQAEVASVSSTGVVTTQTPFDPSASSFVKIMGARQPTGKRVSGIFPVGTITSSTVFNIVGWNYGDTLLGKVRQHIVIYPEIEQLTNPTPRVVVKKVGRPFGGYSGRRSNRT